MAKLIVEIPDDVKKDFKSAVAWDRLTQKEVIINFVCKYIKETKARKK